MLWYLEYKVRDTEFKQINEIKHFNAPVGFSDIQNWLILEQKQSSLSASIFTVSPLLRF